MSAPQFDAAIRQTQSGRADLLVFEVVSKIHRSDMETMAAAVDAAMEVHDQIDILLLFTDFEGVTLGALFDGEAMKVGLRSNTHVRRYAVVGAPAVAEVMIRLFDPVSPVDARTFDLAQLAQAQSWIDGGRDAHSE